MIRDDKSKFLLYMEPKNPPTIPLNDNVTEFMQIAFNDATKGVANYSKIGADEIFHIVNGGYKGTHICSCGERSDNHDYQLKMA